jgi:sortase A
LSSALTVVGLVCCGWVLSSLWRTTITEMDGIRALRIAHVQPAAIAFAPPDWGPMSEGDLIGQVLIPELKIQGTVLAGTEPETLDRAVGHIFGTALPGTGGNVALAAHRSTHFRDLRYVSPGQRIQVFTAHGDYDYQVEWTLVVNPEDVWVLDPSGAETITLVTCFPFDFVGAAPQRFVVRGKLVPPEKEVSPGAEPSITALRSQP